MINTLYKFILLSCCILLTNTLSAKTKASNELGWQNSPCPLCYGHYVEPRLDAKHLKLKPHQSRLLANESEITLTKGQSHLRGGVTIEQVNKQIQADQASYTINEQHKLKQLSLTGHVTIREPGRLLTAHHASIDFANHSATIEHSFYRFAHHYAVKQYQGQHAVYGLTAWGYAEFITQHSKHRYTLQQVSYTTCSPENIDWQITAKEIQIDHQHGRAYARQVALSWQGIPLIRTPYLSYPINDKRQSGFLIPTFAYHSQQGIRYIQPFYINLKPNADITLYPQLYTSRGAAMGTEFRYLDKHYHGELYFNYLPYDRHFKDFKIEYPKVGSLDTARAALSWQHTTEIHPGLHSHIDFNAVSDNYYLKDFGGDHLTLQDWQLRRRADIEYHSRYWHGTFLFQQFQTLQMLANATISSSYSQLPSLSFLFDYPHPLSDVSVSGEYSHFFWPSNHKLRPDGERLWLNPSFTVPLYLTNINIVPRFNLYWRHYHSRNQIGLPPDLNISIPSSSLELSYYHTRALRHLTMLSQFRAYFLWIKFHEQNQIPLYDTAYYPLTFDQLFRDNRFAGYDRIGDTTQLNLSILSHYYRGNNHDELFRLGIGGMLYFKEPQVNLCVSDCLNLLQPPRLTTPIKRFSPLLSQLSLFINQQLSAHGDIAYGLENRGLENLGFMLALHKSEQIFHLSYNYHRHLIRLNEKEQFFTESNQQIGLSSAFKVSPHWHLLGTWSYNLSHHYVQTFYLGTKYDSCCWALTMAAGKTLTSVTQNRHPFYNSGIYLQLSLKGLGTIANRNPDALLAKSIPGFNTNN